jgi:hypothetical protein
MPTESTMLNEPSRPSKANREYVDLTSFGGRRLTAFSRIGRSVGPIIGDACDEALAEALEIRS